MQNSILGAAALVAVLPFSAMATDFDGAVTLGYSKLTTSDGSPGATDVSLDLTTSFAINSNLKLGVDVGLMQVKQFSNKANLNDAAVRLDYRIDNGVSVGGYLEKTSIEDASGGNESIGVMSYGLSSGYEAENYQVTAYFGKTALSGAGNSETLSDYGVSGGYAVNDRLAFVLNVSHTQAPSSMGSANIVDLAATYKFNDQFSMFGGVTRLSAGGSSEVATLYGLGVGYSLEGVSKNPVVLSLEVGRTTQGSFSEHTNVIRAGITFPLGNSKTSTPLNSLAGRIESRKHGYFTKVFKSVF